MTAMEYQPETEEISLITVPTMHIQSLSSSQLSRREELCSTTKHLINEILTTATAEINKERMSVVCGGHIDETENTVSEKAVNDVNSVFSMLETDTNFEISRCKRTDEWYLEPVVLRGDADLKIFETESSICIPKQHLIHHIHPYYSTTINNAYRHCTGHVTAEYMNRGYDTYIALKTKGENASLKWKPMKHAKHPYVSDVKTQNLMPNLRNGVLKMDLLHHFREEKEENKEKEACSLSHDSEHLLGQISRSRVDAWTDIGKKGLDGSELTGQLLPQEMMRRIEKEQCKRMSWATGMHKETREKGKEKRREKSDEKDQMTMQRFSKRLDKSRIQKWERFTDPPRPENTPPDYYNSGFSAKQTFKLLFGDIKPFARTSQRTLERRKQVRERVRKIHKYRMMGTGCKNEKQDGMAAWSDRNNADLFDYTAEDLHKCRKLRINLGTKSKERWSEEHEKMRITAMSSQNEVVPLQERKESLSGKIDQASNVLKPVEELFKLKNTREQQTISNSEPPSQVSDEMQHYKEKYTDNLTEKEPDQVHETGDQSNEGRQQKVRCIEDRKRQYFYGEAWECNMRRSNRNHEGKDREEIKNSQWHTFQRSKCMNEFQSNKRLGEVNRMDRKGETGYQYSWFDQYFVRDGWTHFMDID